MYAIASPCHELYIYHYIEGTSCNKKGRKCCSEVAFVLKWCKSQSGLIKQLNLVKMTTMAAKKPLNCEEVRYRLQTAASEIFSRHHTHFRISLLSSKGSLNSPNFYSIELLLRTGAIITIFLYRFSISSSTLTQESNFREVKKSWKQLHFKSRDDDLALLRCSSSKTQEE